ncbi:MAG: hypothetical protein IJT53_00110, partial [Prevotella sp.]|nr:hypothetical protein [Prevotella sp.]
MAAKLRKKVVTNEGFWKINANRPKIKAIRVVRKKLIEYDVVTFKQKNGKEVWDSKARTTLVGRPEEDILARFNQEI